MEKLVDVIFKESITKEKTRIKLDTKSGELVEYLGNASEGHEYINILYLVSTDFKPGDIFYDMTGIGQVLNERHALKLNLIREDSNIMKVLKSSHDVGAQLISDNEITRFIEAFNKKVDFSSKVTITEKTIAENLGIKAVDVQNNIKKIKEEIKERNEVVEYGDEKYVVCTLSYNKEIKFTDDVFGKREDAVRKSRKMSKKHFVLKIWK